MPAIARFGDMVKGMTDGEHSGHLVPHPPCELTGSISEGSPNVFINGRPAAVLGSKTTEQDCCDSGKSGKIITGSSKVFINGIPAARAGDLVEPHNGTAKVESGSPNVFAG